MTFKETLDIIGTEIFPESAIIRLSEKFEIAKFKTSKEIVKRSSTHIWVDLSIIVDSELLEKYPYLTHIICRATSTTNMSAVNLGTMGIQVLSLKGHTAFLKKIPSTAELAWFLLQTSNVPIFEIQDQITSGSWDRSSLLRNQLFGKRIGIIGLGRLGKIVAKYAETFGMAVGYAELESYVNQLPYECFSIFDLCRDSDFIVITASVGELLDPILNSDTLEGCNPNLRIINVSRGRLVDESCLIQLLTEDKIAFYAADTCRFEEQGATSEDWENYRKLSSLKNVFLTPHIGGYSREAIYDTTNHLIDYLNERICECMVPLK